MIIRRCSARGSSGYAVLTTQAGRAVLSDIRVASKKELKDRIIAAMITSTLRPYLVE